MGLPLARGGGDLQVCHTQDGLATDHGKGGEVSGGTARCAKLTRMARFSNLKHGLAFSPGMGGRGWGGCGLTAMYFIQAWVGG